MPMLHYKLRKSNVRGWYLVSCILISSVYSMLVVILCVWDINHSLFVIICANNKISINNWSSIECTEDSSRNFLHQSIVKSLQ